VKQPEAAERAFNLLQQMLEYDVKVDTTMFNIAIDPLANCSDRKFLVMAESILRDVILI